MQADLCAATRWPFVDVARHRTTDENGDVVRAAGVERILEQRFAHLTRGLHVRQSLGDPLVRDVPRQSIAAEKMDVLPGVLHAGHHRRALLAAERADEHVRERGSLRESLRHYALVDERLSQRLVP